MTPAQLEKARRALVEADERDGGLGNGCLFDPVSCTRCAVGALLDRPDGFGPVTLKAWDKIITQRMSAQAAHPADFGVALPDRGARYLSDVYGLNVVQIEKVVTVSDGADSDERLTAVLDELGGFVTAGGVQ